MNIDYDGVFVKIKDLIIKSVISIEPIIVNNMNRASKNRHLCFELYGYDVLIDQNLRPWLVEVNVLPSFSSSSPLDKTIKTSLVTDVFNTIGVVPYNKKKL
jgi:tubulin polyglutamylase TTLL4